MDSILLAKRRSKHRAASTKSNHEGRGVKCVGISSHAKRWLIVSGSSLFKYNG